MTEHPPPSARTRIRRIARNADYDPGTVHAIVDDTHVCHVSFVDEDGGVHCIPTACWRDGDHLVIHGSNGSRMIRRLAGGAPACVAITLVDGLVLARAAFNHSMNYRSMVAYGQFERVADEHKPALLDRFMEHLVPGRREEARPGDASELAATTLLRLSLREAAAKVRRGGPEDDAADLALPVWAGVVPILRRFGTPVPALGITCKEPASLRALAERDAARTTAS
jgi:nitroimidazol reductase NimA-like FMN-containing flavoprotein (pyridoxamine 5'-phosphate oxidase superfamily)